jgi:hypothetical protein
VIGIIQTDGDEIAGPTDTGAKPRLAGHHLQFLEIGLLDLGEALGRQRLAGNVGHDFRQIADLAIGVDDAGLFASRGPITDELHFSPPDDVMHKE